MMILYASSLCRNLTAEAPHRSKLCAQSANAKKTPLCLSASALICPIPPTSAMTAEASGCHQAMVANKAQGGRR